MDQLNKYRHIIRSTLKPYTDIRYANLNVKNRSAFDTETDQYIILSEGWDKAQHLHGVLIHVEIIDAKVWIQIDGTEDGIAADLIQAGIPKEDIVLGFHEPEVRKYTGFAVA
jgi:XisI protein